MKIGYVLCLTVVLTAGCGTGTMTSSSTAPSVAPQTVAQRDLLTLLPDTASFPAYTKQGDTPGLVALEKAPQNASTWNGFGTLIPVGTYNPPGCTPTRTPDMAPYAGSPFAWKYHMFASTSERSLPTQATIIGSTIARSEVDEAAVRALTTECAIVRTEDGVFARYEILANPQVSSTQVLAIKTEIGLKGGIFRLTYVAQVNEYVVTTYALCTVLTTCAKEMSPVFQNAVSRAS